MNNILQILKDDLPFSNANTAILPPAITAPNLSAQTHNTVADDGLEARNNIRVLIAQGARAVEQLITVTSAVQTPRSYEVLANLLKTVAELNHDLMKVHESERGLTGEPTEGGEVHNHIEKAVFVGSTTELQEMMKQQKAQLNANNTKEKEDRIVQDQAGGGEVLPQEPSS